MANRLQWEQSPYLLQHANNPVDWFPWGEEAFERARDLGRPVFLSIGYATCHWCHVMERESFEDEEVARLLNRDFVSIKVDREERPDVDQIYMTVCQAMTGSGGWPLSVFMTADRQPFYVGTYFPKLGRMGMPGFIDLLHQVAQMWSDNRDRLLHIGAEVTDAIQPKSRTAGGALGRHTLESAYGLLIGSFDSQWGGFSRAPKFPTPHHLTFLLRWHRRDPRSRALEMVEKTLNGMRDGGIFDQVGFGFSRYSVDERWLVPHFEKMLYDQAMLAIAYLEAFQVTGNHRYHRVATEVFTYVLRDMTDSQGAFFCAEDADSEGEEGLFYLWTPEQVEAVVGKDRGDLFCRFFDISEGGNFEHGRSIAHISKPLPVFAGLVNMRTEELEGVLEQVRNELFEARQRRIRPLKDDKILTSWNGLMIVALAKGYQALGDSSYLTAATRAADFILDAMRGENGRLLRRYRRGQVAFPGFLDDYAFLIWALLDLYESGLQFRYLEQAHQLAESMVELFVDERDGGLFYTGRDAEGLIVREKELYDGAIPSSNSVALLDLLRLGRMTGNGKWERLAERTLGHFSGLVDDHPSAYTQFLNALDFAVGPTQEIVIAGQRESASTRAMLSAIHAAFLPNRVLLFADGGVSRIAPFIENLKAIEDRTTAYVCQDFSCSKPTVEIEHLKSLLGIGGDPDRRD